MAQAFWLVYGDSDEMDGSETVHKQVRLRVRITPQTSQDGNNLRTKDSVQLQFLVSRFDGTHPASKNFTIGRANFALLHFAAVCENEVKVSKP